MMFQVVTPSSSLPITLEDAKAFLLQDADITEQDLIIEMLIGAATSQVEAVTGRSIINATFRQTYTSFAELGYLFRSTVSVINSVKYYDQNGTRQTLSSAIYELTIGEPAFIRLQKDQVWPVVDGRKDGIEIEYVAGYGDSAEDVPSVVKLAIQVIMAWMFENRQGQEYPRDTLRALCSSFVVPHAF